MQNKIPIKPPFFFYPMLMLLVLSGCKKDNTADMQKENEQRLFNLYMNYTFKDTIAPPKADGLYYIDVKEGTGKSPETDNWVMLNYVGYAIPGDDVVDTYLENVIADRDLYVTSSSTGDTLGLFGPFKLRVGAHVEGLNEGLTMMKEGGKAILCFTSDLGFGSNSATLLQKISAYQSLRYDVELLEVIQDIESYELQKMIDYADTIPNADTIYDSPTDSYMYYVVDKPTHGSEISNDSVVSISYKGYLTDGRVFDDSGDGTLDFTVGDYSASGSPIMGWHRGVTRFREGETGRLIIPYQLAYGPEGSIQQNVVVIPPYEILVFEITVESVTKGESSSGGA